MGPNVGGHIAPWSLIREILVQIRCYIYSFKAYFTGNRLSFVPSQSDSYFGQNSGFQVPYPRKVRCTWCSYSNNFFLSAPRRLIF